MRHGGREEGENVCKDYKSSASGKGLLSTGPLVVGMSRPERTEGGGVLRFQEVYS